MPGQVAVGGSTEDSCLHRGSRLLEDDDGPRLSDLCSAEDSGTVALLRHGGLSCFGLCTSFSLL
jgi:hypothetical protein